MRSRIIIGISLALLFAVALFIRAYFPYDKVFTADWIKFTGADAYYHMRLVDNLVYNFPHLMTTDPYLIYPGGQGIGNIHFFDRFLATTIWMIGLGSPTEHTIDVVSVYFPAVLGALTVIPVYFIGKELFGHWVGVLSAGLLAILPGEFLGRSILGFTDHHVAEVLFSSIIILFLILAIKAANQRQLTFSHLKQRDWAVVARPAIYSLLAGLFLGIYILTFLGALLLVFLLFVFFVVQLIIDYWKRRSADYLGIIGFGVFLIPLIISLLVPQGQLHLISIVIALLIPPALSVGSWLMMRRKIKFGYYILSVVGLGIIVQVIVFAITSSLPGSMLDAFRFFIPTSTSQATIEMQPVLFPSGNFTLRILWGNFTTAFFLSLVSLGILIYLFIKQGNADKGLLLVWSLLMLVAMLAQRRFAYYFVVNVALLTGYLSWRVLNLVGIKEASAEAVKRPEGPAGRKPGPKKGKGGGFRITVNQINIFLAVLIIFFVVYLPSLVPVFPNTATAIDTASAARYAPSNAWVSSLSWLKENTPEPFESPDAYYQSGESYEYSESAYGVMAWWDYGYFITRIAHRIPNANPSQSPLAVPLVASFFISQDESSAEAILEQLGTKYVILDFETAVTFFSNSSILGKFWAMATWAGKDSTEFFDIYYVPQENQMMLVFLYHPEYYRSLSTRLYTFDGKAVTPESTTVISYQETVAQEGVTLKIITAVEEFDSYEEAEAYLSGQESGNHKIVSLNPFVSPVPLEALENYRLIHSSDDLAMVPNAGEVAAIKIFEFQR